MPTEYITERELKAHLEPLKTDVWAIKADVRTLVLAQAQQQGAADERTKRTRWHEKVTDRKLAYAAIVGSLIAPVAWLHIF